MTVPVPEKVTQDLPDRGIDLNVELVLSEEFQNTEWKKNSGTMSLGKILCKYSKSLGKDLFKSSVTARRPGPWPKGIQARLLPRVVVVAVSEKILVHLEWKLENEKEEILWVDTVMGVGTVGKGLPSENLLHDLFRKSYKVMSTSHRIKQLVGDAPAT